MKVALTTNLWYPAGAPGYSLYTDRLKQMWCDRHGWSYIRTEHRRCAPNRPEWEKLRCVDDALDAGYDWVVWMDADAAPVGMEADVDGYLSGLSDAFVAVNDVNGLNTGVFAVDHGTRARRLLEGVKDRMGDDKYNRPFYEQSAFVDVLAADSELAGLQCKPPEALGWQCYVNPTWIGDSVSAYGPGKWSLHCPGTDNCSRLMTFCPMLEELEGVSDA